MGKKKLKEELAELSELGDNWDSYGAEAFTKETIDKVNSIIDYLDDKYEDPDIVPSSCGIQFEWENGENFLEIDVNGNLSYLKGFGEDPNDWVNREKISDYSEINELLEWLYGVLKNE